jgi:hypothetical protein
MACPTKVDKSGAGGAAREGRHASGSCAGGAALGAWEEASVVTYRHGGGAVGYA